MHLQFRGRNPPGGYLAADETELRELTDSAIAKLRRMSDAEYDALDLFPDFEKEDMDAE